MIAFNVSWKWFVLLHHLHGCIRDTQVFLVATGPEVILYPTQQTNFVFPERLGATTFREGTYAEFFVIQFWNWCSVVLWQGLHLGGATHHLHSPSHSPRWWWRLYLCPYPRRIRGPFVWIFWRGEKAFWLREGNVTTRGERGTKNDFFFNFFFNQSSPHYHTCGSRVVPERYPWSFMVNKHPYKPSVKDIMDKYYEMFRCKNQVNKTGFFNSPEDVEDSDTGGWTGLWRSWVSSEEEWVTS